MNCQLINEIKDMISDLLQKQNSKKLEKTVKADFGGEDEFSGSRKNVETATYRAELNRQSKQLLLLHPPVKFQPKPTSESKVMTSGSKS